MVSIPSRDFFPSDERLLELATNPLYSVSIPSRDFFPSDSHNELLREVPEVRFQSLPGISFLLTSYQKWWRSLPYWWFQSLPGISFLLTKIIFNVEIMLHRSFNPFQGFLSFWLLSIHFTRTKSKWVSIPSRDFFPSDCSPFNSPEIKQLDPLFRASP